MSYVNAYTANDYSKNVELLYNKLKNAEGQLQSSIFNYSSNFLQQQINDLKRVQTDIFKLLGVKDIKDLNDRLKEFNKDMINFSGGNLAKIFTDAIKEANAQERNLFDQMVREYLSSLEIPQNFIDYQVDKAISIVVSQLDSSLKTGQFSFGGGRVGSSQGKNLSGFNETGYDPQKFSAPVIKRFKELMAEKGLWKFTTDEKGNKITDKLWIKDNTTEDTIQVVFDWGGITQEKTQKKAERDFTDEEIEAINQKMIDGIANYAPGNSLFKSILENMAKINNKLFFVGKNEKDVTGVLGEATAVYYLHKIMGKDSYDPSIRWKGGVAKNGTKPHQDIILNEQFGIQVKNTTKQEVIDSLNLRNDFISFNGNGYKVNFQGASLPTILEGARKSGLSDDAAAIFESYFGMLSFNIDYKWKDNELWKKAEPGGPWQTEHGETQIYLDAKKMLASMEKDIQILLQLLATSTMYMQLDNIKISDANILYMVGGAAIFSAVDILTEIKNSLDKMQTSNFSINYENKNNITIVDAINSKASKQKDEKLKYYKKQTYSNLTLSSIIVNSSFTF